MSKSVFKVALIAFITIAVAKRLPFTSQFV
jgi:hypothetical protein